MLAQPPSQPSMPAAGEDFHSNTPLGSKPLLGDGLGWDTKVNQQVLPPSNRAGATRVATEMSLVGTQVRGDPRWVIITLAVVLVLGGGALAMWYFVL
jgi:hypothetical protein